MLYAKFIHANNGWIGDRERAKRAGLKVGEKYEIEFVSVGRSYTSVYLKNIDGFFNSVLFDFEEEDGTPVNIYNEPKYSLYR